MLTKAEKRVAIARDVIKQINGGKLEACTGAYVKLKQCEEWEYAYEIKSLIDVESQNPVTKRDTCNLRKNCYVCAKAALFLTRIDKFNKITRNDLSGYVGNNLIMNSLCGIFSREQLNSIERYFESYFVPWSDIVDDNDRLLAICQNIVDHKGTFKPEVLYEVG